MHLCSPLFLSLCGYIYLGFISLSLSLRPVDDLRLGGRCVERVCVLWSAMLGSRTDSATVPFESWRRDGGDVLMLARQFTCTTKASIQSLFEFLKPPPQAVHLVLAQSSGCTAAQQLLPPGRLRCYDEARVLPIAARTVAQRYEEMPGSPQLPAAHRGARRRLRDPTRLGWYFQQFVKLGFPLFNAISTDFLVWDSDAVLIAPFEPVGRDGQLRLVTGGYSNMPQVTPASDACPPARLPACPPAC